MKPIYIENFTVRGLIDKLIYEINWVSEVTTRKEAFMSDIEREYQYITDGPIYKSQPMHPIVKDIMEEVNKFLGSSLDVCFLNYYENNKKALGWHSDDSHPIDQTQPIAVVSIGQAREIWWKPIGDQGVIPDNQKQLLEDGSLFVMPAGMQDTHRHKIPKGDREMGARVSLTFRAWKND